MSKNKLTEPQQEWVDALRSGKYTQGVGALRNTTENTWCCLGVACDLYNKRFPGQLDVVTRRDHESDQLLTYFNEKLYTLPYNVMVWLGLRNELGYINDCLSLIRLNDTGSSFEEIADTIESIPEKLFINEQTN